VRVEPADRLDRVAEEVEADGRLLAWRIEVDQTAADGEVAHLVDQVGAAEAVAQQALGELLQRMVLARPHVERGGGEVLGPRQAAEERPRGRDDRGGLTRPDAVDGHRLLGADQERGLGLLVGGEGRGGEVDHPVLAAEQPGGLEPGQGVGLAGDDHEERPAEVAGQELADPGGGGHGQAHHVPEPLKQGLVGRTSTKRPGELLPHAVGHLHSMQSLAELRGSGSAGLRSSW
jgi:hypothetical protein